MGAAAFALAGAFAVGPLPEPGACAVVAGVAGARVQDSVVNVTATNATPIRPTMIDPGAETDDERAFASLRLSSRKRWRPLGDSPARADRPAVVARRERHGVIRDGIDHRPGLTGVVGPRGPGETDRDD